MLRLALVMGKQGSGKTTRVCRAIQRALPGWNLRHWARGRAGTVRVVANHYNHLGFDAGGRLVLVTGIRHGRVAHAIEQLGTRGARIVELPHSGYIPPGAKAQLDGERIRTRIFALELPEAQWRAIGGVTGSMTSPEWFMTRGPLRVPRSECDYAAETARIRREIALSGVPASFHARAEELVEAVRAFVLG